MSSILALVVSICFGGVGQLSLKAGALQHVGKGVIFPHTYIIVGLVLYTVATVFYIYAIRKIPLSVAYPSLATGYVAVAYSASVIWNEQFGWPQIVGLIAIGFGVFMLFQYAR